MNILIIYYSRYVYPLRNTINDHLYCFKRYSGYQCYYLNMSSKSLPNYLFKVKFDLVIYHTIFLSQRWIRDGFIKLMQVCSSLKKVSGIKIAIPQDEFVNTDLLCDFINDFNIDFVFSVAPESEWSKIYANINKNVKINRVLTGYLDEKTIKETNRLSKNNYLRDIDIGYRAWRAEPWLGRHGYLKTEIADIFQKKANLFNLKTDISTRDSDTFLGNKWYEFLLRCKYTIGVEGGASILDRDGSFREKTTQFLKSNPNATYQEIKAVCFPNQDGKLKLFALSPRNLEACATKTCQILIEGQYNNILKEDVHYIGLKRDFSNLDEIFEKIKDNNIREQITENAYKDIVASSIYNYQNFVNYIIKTAMNNNTVSKKYYLSWLRCTIRDWLLWKKAAIITIIISIIRRISPAALERIKIIEAKFIT